MREDAALISDFNSVPGFDTIKNYPFAAKLFQSSTNPSLQLKVMMANRLALEEQTGAEAAREHRPRRSRRPSAPQLPVHVRKEIAAFARNLAREHRAVFALDPICRKRAGQLLTALLPPKPRRRGRPGRPDVTQAIRLLNRFIRHYPDERPAGHWARMYAAVIPGYGDMNSVQRRDADNA